MSLPSPKDVFNEIRRFLGEVLFVIVSIFLVSPAVQWALMFIGVLAVMIGRHWVLGGAIFLLGLGGAYVARNLRI